MRIWFYVTIANERKFKTDNKKVCFFLHFLMIMNIINCLYLHLFHMKKVLVLLLWILVSIFWFQIVQAERTINSPTTYILDQSYKKANKGKDWVQRTRLNDVSYKFACDDSIAWDIDSNGKYYLTLTRTLCYLKSNIWDYFQYIMYIWLAAATIFIVWNWFQIVTSQDREKQIWTFKKNLIYVIIWVVLLVAFNYIIDIFVSVVNLVAWE